jgi:hypothetical protein
MLRTILLFAAAGFINACNNEGDKTAAADTTAATATAPLLTETEIAEGWISLFDGQTTNGWHTYGGTPVGSAWKIADGAIYLDTTNKQNGKIVGGGNITTDEEFENFHLKLEWKIAPGGNSGILFLTHEDTSKFKQPYESAPEMQVLDNEGHPDAKITKHRAGDLYDLISCSTETVKPAGEWNLAEIVINNGKLEQWLNGTKVVETTLWDDNWNKMIAGSKFKAWPGFGTYKKGKITLQDHDNTVWFKNIKIKKL